MLKKLIVNTISSLNTSYYSLMSFGSKIYYRMVKVKRYYRGEKRLSKEEKQLIKSFWKRYTNDFSLAYHKYYLSNADFDVRYIPDDLYVAYIDPYFNSRHKHDGVCDKNYFDVLFRDSARPENIVRMINGQLYDGDYRLINVNTAATLLTKEEEYVSKPATASCGGANVEFHKGESETEVIAFLSNLPANNMVFQRPIHQHVQMSRIHENSVNTLRLMTLLISGKVHFLSGVLRMGVGDSRVDNAMHGGIFCGINPDGSLKSVAFDQKGRIYHNHPSGISFGGIVVPGYQKAVNMVIREAEKMAHFRMISWDVAIGENAEPILIEANLQMGDIDIIQPVNGPLFGELTEAVLDEVFHKHTAN